MLSPNKINLAARMKSGPQGQPRISGAFKVFAPFAAVALATLISAAALALGADSLYKKMQSEQVALSTSLEEAYAEALALDLRRDSDTQRLARLESLAASLGTYPRFGGVTHGAIYSAASRLGVEILGLGFDMETGAVTISCAAKEPALAAGYAALLGESFSHVRYDGYTLTGGGDYSFYLVCLPEVEG